MTLAVPFPRQLKEINIQPSLERWKAKDLLDSEIEETWSKSATRLFSFLSPEKAIPVSPARVDPQMKTNTQTINFDLITNGLRDAA
jgi:hypothetical protein